MRAVCCPFRTEPKRVYSVLLRPKLHWWVASDRVHHFGGDGHWHGCSFNTPMSPDAVLCPELSIAVPVCNSLTFVFTAVTGYLLGERSHMNVCEWFGCVPCCPSLGIGHPSISTTRRCFVTGTVSCRPVSTLRRRHNCWHGIDCHWRHNLLASEGGHGRRRRWYRQPERPSGS